jgi:hypothetical protein
MVFSGAFFWSSALDSYSLGVRLHSRSVGRHQYYRPQLSCNCACSYLFTYQRATCGVFRNRPDQFDTRDRGSARLQTREPGGMRSNIDGHWLSHRGYRRITSPPRRFGRVTFEVCVDECDLILSSKSIAPTFKAIQSNAGFLLDLEGHKIIALKLPSKIAKEISGQGRSIGSILERVKSKLGLTSETERWLTVTSVNNPLLEQYEKFGTLVAQELSTATGTKIATTDLAISAGMPILGTESPAKNVEGE